MCREINRSRRRWDKFTWLGADCYVLVHLHCLGGWEENVQQCVLSSRTVGGPNTCLCIPALPATQLHHSTVSHFTPCLNTISVSQAFTPLGLYDVEPVGALLSDQWSKHALVDKGAGSPSWITQLGYFNLRPVSEPTVLMCNVSLHCCAIGGLPFPYLLHVLLDFSRGYTSIVLPETPHAPAWSDFSLSLFRFNIRPRKYHQQEDFSQADVLRNPSRRLSQSPYNHLRLSKLSLMVWAWDNSKLSGVVVGGKGSVHFMQLTQLLLSRMSDGGWVEREHRTSCFPDGYRKGLDPVDDPYPSWPGSQFCCQQLLGMNMFTPFILKSLWDWQHLLIPATFRPQWISNCCLWGKVSWSCMLQRQLRKMRDFNLYYFLLTIKNVYLHWWLYIIKMFWSRCSHPSTHLDKTYWKVP